VERVTDAFFTTRRTRRMGLGLPLFAATCERCGGKLQITSQPGTGTTVRGVMQAGHLDRPPLGDLGAVLQALALESGRTAVRYEHAVGRRSFCVDTAELQKELGEAPLTSPDALVWLREYVQENLKEIGSRG
jgi:hypothetical protein